MSKLTEKLRKAKNIDDVKTLLEENGVRLDNEKVHEIYEGIRNSISDDELEKVAAGMAQRFDVML